MYVGFIRTQKSPSKFVKLLSIACRYNGLTLIYLNPHDIIPGKKVVEGKVYLNNNWEKVRVPIPNFIDISPHYFSNKKHRKLLNYLKEESKLSINRRHIITKDKLQQELKRNKDLMQYSIPSENNETFHQFYEFLDYHMKIVIKPVTGLQGKSVMVLTKENDELYILGSEKNETKLTKKELIDFYDSHLLNKNYMFQKYVVSRNVKDEPFDCRVHMEKNGDGSWDIANMIIRIGVGQKVVSNISQGGGISNLRGFLISNFQNKADSIYDDLVTLANYVPKRIEEITNSELMVMGIDVGIDSNGNLYIFEINSFPIIAPQLSEITLLRPQYYKFRLKNDMNKNKSNRFDDNKTTKASKQDINFLKENRKIKKQNEILIKKIKQMENSNSWLITKPMRKISKLLKDK